MKRVKERVGEERREKNERIIMVDNELSFFVVVCRLSRTQEKAMMKVLYQGLISMIERKVRIHKCDVKKTYLGRKLSAWQKSTERFDFFKSSESDLCAIIVEIFSCV